AHHEVHDRLRGINDAVGVRLLGREALKEALVDGVEKALFLRKIGGVLRVYLNGVIKAVEVGEKGVAAEVLAGKGVNHLLNFSGDDVAARELRVIEDAAEDALREQVLDQHGLNRFFREVGIDGLAAELDEALKGGDEILVLLALGLDQLFDCAGDLRDALRKFID